PAEPRPQASGEVAQHVAAPLPAGGYHRQQPLHEPAPDLAVGPTTDPTPDHGVPQRAFGRVVRRLDALDPREGPQAVPEPQQLAAGRRRLRAGADSPTLQARTDHRP